MNFYTAMTSSLDIIHCDILRITNYDCITFEGYLTLKKGSDENVIKTQMWLCARLRLPPREDVQATSTPKTSRG
jgi:hypothetical protein